MLSDNIYDFVIETARSSPSKKKVGAVLLNKNKVVTSATNLETKSHPLQARFAERVGLHEKIYLHAEIAALVKCKSDADTIVVARLGGHHGNEIRNAKPCKICRLALQHAGIKDVYYTTNDGFLYEYVPELN